MFRSGGLITAGLVLGLMILPVIGWFVWREREKGRIPGNEGRAMTVLRFLAYCERDFRALDLDRDAVSEFWTGDVAGLLSSMPVTPSATGWLEQSFSDLALDRAHIARADPARPDAEPYFGYWFVPLEADRDGSSYQVKGRRRHPWAFGFCAYPARPGRTGGRVFIINEINYVFCTKLDLANPRKWPDDTTLKHRWYRPD